MPREFFRADRVGDAIQRYLANMIQQEIRDPRVGLVNINSVTVSRDMAYAKVYITLVGGTETSGRESAEVLNNASGFLRTLLAKELNMRTVPRLQFYYDHTSVRGQELSSLIDRAVAADKAKGGDEDS
ncbi:30S ribosome-binding factor RbfA [Gilvimarinus algae]|uniref:Ribosome-binding factor A n=1 Tax=Gilvimarinus algae TaxID=3058037 RepID=A0ABT8TH67_9GAMM|nr:30S ribosome-binding factor RbfA [Gilvimarinus sp. SDUM040014]MDO3383403.1 30S ribosome-binding factor RbfA [Gilvimarinus sp. SDUM040014]